MTEGSMRDVRTHHHGRVLRRDNHVRTVKTVGGTTELGVDLHCHVRTVLRLRLKNVRGLETLRSNTDLDIAVGFNVVIRLNMLGVQDKKEDLRLHVRTISGLLEELEKVRGDNLANIGVHDRRILNKD